jgi:hypothetical protein
MKSPSHRFFQAASGFFFILIDKGQVHLMPSF